MVQDGVLLARDWLAFFKYSRHVRVLGSDPVGRKIRMPTDDSVITLLCSLRPTMVLLPNVHTVRWNYQHLGLNEACCPQLLSLLAGDQVTDINIFGWPPAEDVALRAALAAMDSRFPRLHTLSVSFDVDAWNSDPTPRPTSQVISLLVCTLPLVEFFCPNVALTADAVIYLVHLPTLRKLNMRLADDDYTRWRPLDVPPAGLVNLKYGWLDIVSTVATYIAFSRAVSLPAVTVLNLAIIRSANPPPYRDLSEAIRRQFSSDMLHTLGITPYAAESDVNLVKARQSAVVVRPADFAPLFDFVNMYSFNFAAECRHALDDELFLDMVKAWPKLSNLDVSYPEYCAYDTYPTPNALVHIAAHGGPSLVTLGLQFDALTWASTAHLEEDDMAEELFGELAHRASRSQAGELHVGLSPIDSPQHVAMFLARIFPSIYCVYAGDFGDTEQGKESRDQWAQVEQIIPLLGILRLDERRRMKRKA